MAEEIKKELAPIGIRVRIVHVESSLGAIHQPGAPYDLKVGESSFDPLAAEAYVEQMLTAFPPGSPLTSVLPEGWKSPAVRAATARLPNLPTEAAILALLHGTIQREVPMTGIAYEVNGALFDPRIGCRVFPPASFGVDFAALCLA